MQMASGDKSEISWNFGKVRFPIQRKYPSSIVLRVYVLSV